jgi:beta-1,4-mannosyl-glycoprotein beta-1,4-N-acetylglucosaminyltransferase
MNKVIDTFAYCGEDDLLDIRLNTLKDIVDETIIIESNLSHTLIKKPLFFPESKERFSQFNIKYIVQDFTYDNPFYNDWAGRVAVFNAIEDKSFNNVLIHSDLDELPNPEKLKEIIDNLNQPVCLRGDYFMFCVDLWGRLSNDALVMKYGWVQQPLYKYRDARNSELIRKVDNSSWHFSSVGTPENVARKWHFFAHASEVDQKYKDPEYIKSQIKRKAGSWSEFAPDNELKLIEHKYPNLPQYLLDNKEKFEHLFYNHYNK